MIAGPRYIRIGDTLFTHSLPFPRSNHQTRSEVSRRESVQLRLRCVE